MSNEDTRTLLSQQARQSTKDELAARRKAQRERLQAFWDDCFDLIESFARECIVDSYTVGKISDCETALQNVAKKLRRCKAQTREGFLSWAVRMLSKEKGFHLAAKAIRDFDLSISDWIADAATRLTRYADFPECHKENTAGGMLYRLNMGTREDGSPIVWTLPQQYWEFVHKIWPVTLKQRADGSYFIAKLVAGQTIPVHRLILNCGPTDTVQSMSHNFLDWTSLYVRPLNRSGLYAGRNTSWNHEADRSNTVQEEFESRFQSTKVLEQYATNFDNTERFLLPRPVRVNEDLCDKTTCWGGLAATGWVDPITPVERDLADATERYLPRVSRSVRMQAAAKALTALGL